jgi:hypothetical protein
MIGSYRYQLKKDIIKPSEIGPISSIQQLQMLYIVG